MKILHLHDEVWDSGLAHYAYTLAEAQHNQGHEVHFWAQHGSIAAQKARAAGLLVRELNQPWASLPSLRAAVKSAGIEIINAHTGSTHSLGTALAWRRRMPVVRTWADARSPCANLAKRFLANRTALFIAANSKIASELKTQFPSTIARLILPGIPDFERPLKEPPKDAVIGILGRLDPVKGHDDVLDAAVIVCKQYPRAIFLAAGEGQSGRLSKLNWQANFLGLGSKLKFLERVQDVCEFMDGCSMGLVASRGSEAVSRAAIEWMSRGKAVIATRVGGLPDTLLHGETGLLIPPGDPKTMAKAISGLIADPAFTARLGQKARKRFTEKFSLQPFILATEEAYGNAISRFSR